MTTDTTDELRLKLAVPRHLQDYNGYCGPACALMVEEALGRTQAATDFAQNEIFRRIRKHAQESQDRRPVKSPAESLLALLNAGEARGHETVRWEKAFDHDPQPIAARILQTILGLHQPCLLLINKGLHWVVAFGRMTKDDGTPAGLLLRDPAWAGMPKFYGLSIFPEQPAVTHTASPCACLNADQQPGTVHERYLAMDEVLSTRGLQGSPDWDGIGALALIPAAAAALPLAPALPPLAGTAALPASTAQLGTGSPDLGQIALQQTREHGLWGRADSPADWQQALQGANAGEPLLVKSPEDRRDDFYLIPFHPAKASHRTAYVMLDAATFQLREASLLDHWPTLAYPDQQDSQRASENQQLLADGTAALFKAQELRPNQKNLVWKASAASILPYWPLKELTAPHPITREPVSVYVTQKGEIYSQLAPDEITMPKLPKSWLQKTIPSLLGVAVAGTAGYFLHQPLPANPPSVVTNQIVNEIENPEWIKEKKGMQKKQEQLEAQLVAAQAEIEQTKREAADEIIKEVEVPVESPKLIKEVARLNIELEATQAALKKYEQNHAPQEDPTDDPPRDVDQIQKELEFALEKIRMLKAGGGPRGQLPGEFDRLLKGLLGGRKHSEAPATPGRTPQKDAPPGPDGQPRRPQP